MKVKCINNGVLPKSFLDHVYLTNGKVYEVVKEDDRSYYVIDDEKQKNGYYKSRFELVKEEKMFSNAKVGDRVWDFQLGWGKVDHFCNDKLKVLFDNGKNIFYNIYGKVWENDINPSLFWDEIKFDIPLKPKRKVKKTIEMWTNIYPEGHLCCYSNRIDADLDAVFNRIACVKVSGEYEVEED